ncbi:hypothetical protein [Denitromonas sp.]|uniref:hypothetical protein n=1 Tax=Denitromonas sp. TaxID=2734609 RepID=UPI0013BD1AFE|nr:hypothetical protein [Denitromonas sp.]KAA3652671.1 MAG: hypothetical protein DWQ11_11285 [Pseudomonadota bacterium]
MRALALTLVCAALAGCAAPGSGPAPRMDRGFTLTGLAKSDIDKVTEIHHHHLFQSLRRLTLKLYRRNPAEWRKQGMASAEAAVADLFDRDHRWRLESLNYRYGAEAIQIALTPDYPGDRVRAFITGLVSMVQKALGDRAEFYMLDKVDAQRVYNAARNVEVAAWKLGQARDAQGQLLLLSNEMAPVANLSFEREFGRQIGLLDALADVHAERDGRTITRVIQNAATAVFLPL